MPFTVRIPEALPFLIGVLAAFGAGALVFALFRRKRAAFWLCVTGLALAACLLYFFRDPMRNPPLDANSVVAGADGIVMGIKEVIEDHLPQTNAIRISIFLSLFDVHVNRAPIAGRVTKLGYYPGKRFFTFQEKSSEFNRHSVILIETEHTSCVVKQIVGPVARRVVYWLEPGQQLAKGERIGMMKFGSRLDIYLPLGDVDVCVKKGDRVRAGETILALLRAPKQTPLEANTP